MIAIGAAFAMIVALAVLTAFGVQVAIALGLVSVTAVYAATGDWQVVSRFIVAAVYDGLRNDVIIAIPLFMLMGEFIARSGAVSDIFAAASRRWSARPGGALLAASVGNALYSFVSGSSVGGSAGFSRIAMIELVRRGHDRALSMGTLAGASALGMLLPPSVLMLAWSILGRQPAGTIFLAMLVPGLLVAIGFVISVLGHKAPPAPRPDPQAAPAPPIAVGLVGLAALFVIVGGVGLRVISAAEAASLGAAIGLAMALAKGMRPAGIVDSILVVGRACAPILMLILAALLYAQALALTGAGAAVTAALLGLGAAGAIAAMLVIWLVLVIMFDALSAIVLTAALFIPVGAGVGLDGAALGVLGVLVAEAAALAPPLGLLVFTTKAAAGDETTAVADIFRHVWPLLAILTVVVLLVAAFPKIATWLPLLIR